MATERRAGLAGAVTILYARAQHLAGHGRRQWEPSPRMPALVIICDEYAELAEQAPAALKHTDTIARLGRAPAVPPDGTEPGGPGQDGPGPARPEDTADEEDGPEGVLQSALSRAPGRRHPADAQRGEHVRRRGPQALTAPTAFPRSAEEC